VRTAAVAACLLLAVGCARQVTFSVTLAKAHGLEAGQAVVYHGVKVGEITAVTVTETGRVKADVVVTGENAKAIYREAVFSVQGNSLLDPSAQRYLLVSDRQGAPRSPVRRGDTLVGQEPLLDRLLGSSSRSAEELVAQGKALLGDIVGIVSQLPDTPRGRQLREAAAELGRRLERVSKEEWPAFLAQRRGDIDAAARAYREELEREGKRAEAEEFWKRYQAWSGRLK
jgi:hypothetical protein